MAELKAEKQMRTLSIALGLFLTVTSAQLPVLYFGQYKSHHEVFYNIAEGRSALTSIRTSDGSFHVSSSLDAAPVLVYFLHIFPALVWTVQAPFQFSTDLRRKAPNLHRRSGYLFFATSGILGLSGMVIILKKITYSSPDILHLHWGFLPTFDLGLTLLGLLFVGTLFLALEAIVMSRDLARHRIWVITHVLLGMTVHYQRVLMYTVIAVANALHPFNILPPNGPKAWAMELDCFAATGYGGFGLSALSIWWIVGPLLKTKSNSDSQSSAKNSKDN